MLDRLRALVRSLVEPEGSDTISPDSPRLAAAALMYHVIQADGVLTDSERARFADLLREEFTLDEDALQDLMAAAEAADDEAVDLYRFTSVLMQAYDAAGRTAFIEMLWEMVYADGKRHELEDNVVWRIAELLGVSGRDRVKMRQLVQARHGMAKEADIGGEGNDDL